MKAVSIDSDETKVWRRVWQKKHISIQSNEVIYIPQERSNKSSDLSSLYFASSYIIHSTEKSRDPYRPSPDIRSIVHPGNFLLNRTDLTLRTLDEDWLQQNLPSRHKALRRRWRQHASCNWTSLDPFKGLHHLMAIITHAICILYTHANWNFWAVKDYNRNSPNELPPQQLNYHHRAVEKQARPPFLRRSFPPPGSFHRTSCVQW